MFAIEISEFGTPSVLKSAHTDAPTPLASQVVIQNHAIAIDPFDVKFVSGAFGEKKLPLIPGSSVVGEVIAVGDNVTEFKIGDRVGATRYLKSYAEQVPVNQKNLAKVPENLSDVTAVAAVLGAATGFEMITRVLDVRPQQNILITGAAGAVGQVALQAALLRGANVFAMVRPNQIDRVSAFGPVTVIEPGETPSVPLDGILNTITDDTAVIAAAHALASNGKLVSLTPLPTVLSQHESMTEVYSSGAGDILAELYALIAEGKITLAIADVNKFNEHNLRAAHQTMLADHPQGKLVLTF